MTRQIDRLLVVLENFLIAVLTLTGLAMAFLQVILRYVFNTGLHWLEAALVTVLVWAMLIGAVRAVREGLHPRVELLVHMLPPRGRAVLNFAALAVTLGLIGLFLWDSIFYARFLTMINALHPELGIPMIYPFLIIPISMSLMGLRYLMIGLVLWREPAAMMPDADFRDQFGAGRTEGLPQ